MRRPAAAASRRDCSGPSPARSRAAVTALAVLAAASWLTLPGCTGARANSHYRYPRDVAYGRPSTCPDVRLPPLRDGGMSPDAARCSFNDANGARVTHLAGKVLAEGGPGDPGTAVPEVAVTVHTVTGPVFDVTAPGPVLAHATTDAQGNYSLRGVFVAGDYAIVVREPTGERITERIVRVEPNALGSLKDLRVMVPLDPRLRAEAVEPPTPAADPRLRPPPVPTAPTTPASTPTTPASTPTTAPTSTSPASTPAAKPGSPATPAAKPAADPRLRMRPPVAPKP